MFAKRIVSLALCFLMLAAFVACSGDSSANVKKDTTAAHETTAVNDVATHERVESDLPELDFGGRTVRFISGGVNLKKEIDEEKFDMNWNGQEISAEELTNDPVNDAIYNRNMVISDLLNIEIEEKCANTESINNMVSRDIASGDGEYDIIAGSVCWQMPLLYDGSVYDLCNNGIENYVDLKKPWWSQLWIEQAMMGDRLYAVTGSLSLSLKRLLFVTYFNKNMAESEGVGDLYQVVRNGDWTIDYLTQLSSKIYKDVNGNSERDNEDIYGLITNHYECVDSYWSSFDMHLLQKDEDKLYVLAGDQEKISKALDIVFALTYENTGTYDFIDSFGYTEAKKMFASGRGLFATMQLKFAESEAFRNMTDDYGILPCAKFDKNQKEYYTYAQDQYTVFMIPVSVKDVACSAAVLEAMACESYNMVEVAFLDNALKGRYSNDSDTRLMIDLIIDGYKVDPAFIYGKLIGYPTSKVFLMPIYSKKGGFAAEYQKMTRTIDIFIADVKSKVESLDY